MQRHSGETWRRIVRMIDIRFFAYREGRLVQSDGIGKQVGRTPAQPPMLTCRACWPTPGQRGGSRYRKRLRRFNEKRAVD